MVRQLIVVFVHGWSVTTTKTYGGLPARLRTAAAAQDIELQVKDIFLGRYISFHDVVRVSDISRAFRTALGDELADDLADGARFVCITHSTGGPVIRDWWHRYYELMPQHGVCPMSHLIMLAPANYGSALAQLGKERIGRLKSWFADVEPGQGVLNWLELGSRESWDLNTQWVSSDGSRIGPLGVFPFVLTGQSIDRAFYDNLNSYTGELGSDGVVRVAAANLRGTYIKLTQEAPRPNPRKKGEIIADELIIESVIQAPATAFRIISGKSHSGKTMGIMQSVREAAGDQPSQETIDAILACLRVQTDAEYRNLCDQFLSETQTVQEQELLETEEHLLAAKTLFFHDRFSMLIFSVSDDAGHPVSDYDMILTAGPEADPNHLPTGFFVDRQNNHLNHESITYFINYDVMTGADAVTDKAGKIVRAALPGTDMLGLQIRARPDSGFVHYLPCEIKASRKMLESALHPNATTLIDIRLRRVVRKNVFRLDRVTSQTKPVDFERTKPSDEIVE